MDMDLAHYLLTEPRKGKENPAARVSPSKEAYRKLLAEKLLNNRTRILAFRNKPPEPETMLTDLRADATQAKPAKQRRQVPQVCTPSYIHLLFAFARSMMFLTETALQLLV